ncbi:MAG: hypothetical protein QOJ09_1657 [Actinomycetota bacterium]|nr:hypothetical protein [Actinomycetota bacterium]
MPTRSGIEGKLAKQRAALLDRYRQLGAEQLTEPCTESEHEGGAPWSAKDHLAHLAMIERTFQGIVERTLAGEAAPVGLGGRGQSLPDIMATVHRMNEEHVDANRGTPLEELLGALEAVRADTLSLLDRIEDDELARPVPGAPWADGTIGGVLITLGYHDQQHVAWVDEALGAPRT